MLLGWLRRRKLERQERYELERFAAEIEQEMGLLVDLLSEDEVPFTTDHMFDLRYQQFPEGRAFNVPYTYKLPVVMPEPRVSTESFWHHDHQMQMYTARVCLSDQEWMFRRTPMSRKELALMVAERIQGQFTSLIMKQGTQYGFDRGEAQTH